MIDLIAPKLTYESDEMMAGLMAASKVLHSAYLLVDKMADMTAAMMVDQIAAMAAPSVVDG